MTVRNLLSDRAGASAAEFALVLPLFLLLLLGIIDAGRYMWTINRAEKAAQMGVRMAVVTDSVAAAVNDNYVGQCSLTAGDPIPVACFSEITCTKTTGTANCTTGAAVTAAFNRVMTRMRAFMPELQDDDVQIIYSPSGLGYAGNPSGPDVAPIVTVRLSGLTFRPIILFAVTSIGLPVVHSSLTFEDGTGVASN